MRVCIVIPAYEPGGEFVPYAQEVLAAGLGPVLVVDDGSGPAYAPVFAALAEMGCTVLTHEQNRGKGAALKTALRWYGAHEDGCAGIVTADLNRAHRVIHQLEAGICWINTWGESPAEMPVGGYKHSGIGRENGVMTLQSYTQVKSIQVEMAKFQSIF